jgi:putative phosphoesterase
MKILVLSDSHAGLSFMRYCISKVKPDHVVHLGDHFDDGTAMAEEYSHIRFHQVPGNCDRYRCDPWQVDILCYEIGNVRFYMTHGHKHGVKSGLGHLLLDARKSGAQAVLFGHTHEAYCQQESDGLWVLNPGSCRGYSGSAGVVEVQQGKISSCRIVQQEDMESM